MRFDCCRSAGSTPTKTLADSEPGIIPGAVAGEIPPEYQARRPIYLEGPISLSDFLSAGKQQVHELERRPVTSRFSFVSTLSIALLAALLLCCRVEALDGKHDRATRFADSDNLRIAHNAQNLVSSEREPIGRIISFVCGRPNTLQALAPIDLPSDSQMRRLPQGASPIAEMKFMPGRKQSLPNKAPEHSEPNKVDAASTDRIYRKLVKLSLCDPAVYNAEAPSLITYFSILTAGQDQRRVEELQTILEKSLNHK